MLNMNDEPDLQIRMGGAVANRKSGRVKGSIRELELIAAELRRDGELCRADEIDREIMAILDRKICRKIIKRSRKEQKLLNIGSY
ncbi:MAG: hypothetical protein ABW092_08285 [Candidatus Thiodiazotropha sp.]